MDLMVIGAHAFDAEIMAAGAVLMHVRRGGTAAFVHLTLGEMGHPTLSADEYAAQKRRESVEAARRAGVEVLVAPFADAHLGEGDDVVSWIESAIVEGKPSHIVTHWTGSVHEDHRACGRAVEKAVFRAGLPGREGGAHAVQGLYYGENWEDPLGFERHVFVDVSAVTADWVAVMSAYELFAASSDLSTFRYRQYYSALRGSVGALIGVEAAEAFMLPAFGLRVRRQDLCDPEYRLTSVANIIQSSAHRRPVPD